MAEAALYRLLTWLSPGYPLGAFSYSHGLEHAVEAGLVRDAAGLEAYAAAALAHGAARVDAALLAAAWDAARRDDLAALEELADLGVAWRGSAELGLESAAQGDAFLRTTIAASPHPLLAALAARRGAPGAPTPLPVALGAAAAAHGVPMTPTATAFLHAFAAGLISAGVRLVPLGQTEGQRVLAALETIIHTAAAEARSTPLDEVGTAVPVIDWCSMRHETQHTRLFRS